LRDELQHFEILLALFGGKLPGANAGEFGYIDPERVGRSEVVGLMRKDEIEAVKSIAR
jgi:hypothetical protein